MCFVSSFKKELVVDTKLSYSLKMCRKKRFVVSLILASTTLASSIALKPCRTDIDCLANEYCYEDTKYCSACIDCSQYGQKDPAGCAKEPRDCEDCLPGYINDPHNEYKNGRRRCINIDAGYNTATESNYDKNNNSLTLTHHIFISVGIVILVGACIGLVYWFCNWRKDKPQVSHETREETAPFQKATAPPDLMNLSYSQDLSEGAWSNHSLCPPPYSDTRINDPRARAVPFATPNNIRPPINLTQDDTDAPSGNNMINMHDDDDATQQSPWRPSSTEGERTSFAGCIQNSVTRRHSNSDNTQDQDVTPPKQAKNSVTNVTININTNIAQSQVQTNTFSTNISNSNEEDNDLPNTRNEDLSHNCGNGQLRRYQNN